MSCCDESSTKQEVNQTMARFKMDRRIRLASADRAGKYAVQGVTVDIGKARAVAADGRILAIRSIDVQDPGEGADGIIPVEIMDGGLDRPDDEFVLDGNECKDTTRGRYGDMIEGKYPDWRSVVPEIEDDDAEASATYVSLDANVLARLAEALGSDGPVTLRIESPRKPIAVVPSIGCGGDDPAAFGLIMPCTILFGRGLDEEDMRQAARSDMRARREQAMA